MIRRIALTLLIALQLFVAFAWPVRASAQSSTEHTVQHTLLVQHHHDDAAHHHDHDSEDSDDLQLSAADDALLTADAAGIDHHHHVDFNVNMAVLQVSQGQFALGHAIQNPRVLPAMYSAEKRKYLRPPQA